MFSNVCIIFVKNVKIWNENIIRFNILAFFFKYRKVPRADERGAAGRGREDQRARGGGVQDQAIACE